MLIGSIRCRKRFTRRLIEKQICSEIRERPTLKVNIFKTISLNSNVSAALVLNCFSFTLAKIKLELPHNQAMSI